MMRIQHSLLLLLLIGCLPAFSIAQGAVATQPGYDTDVVTGYGANQQRLLAPLPPHLPQYLPNGAVNLDEIWTQDGGARLYWNDVLIPRELNMAGNSWVDPALVPQLIPEKQTPVRRVWRRARTRPTTIKKAKVPPKVASTALKTPAIPLPMTPVETEKSSIPPLKAEQPTAAQAASPTLPRANTEMPDVTPPPLQ